jgi:hypothetical protein
VDQQYCKIPNNKKSVCLIILPNAEAIINRLEKVLGKENIKPLAIGLYLGIAFR